jgi:hypothetical protein
VFEWPPFDYPEIAPVEPTETGCTLDAWAAGLSELTAEDPAVAATTTREVRPIFVSGQGGILRWSVSITVLGGAECDVQQQVIFVDDDDAQVDRWTGQAWTGQTGIILSARLPVPRRATKAWLKVLSLCDTAEGEWTEEDTRLEQIPADPPYIPPAVDPTFGDVSPEGVAAPAPSAGLPGGEANSPARRSPQVRWCQVNDSIRPDLTAKKNARDV